MNKKQPNFLKTLGDTPKVRVLNFLLLGRGLDYSMSDIARNSKIGWTTLNRIWGDLIKSKIILHTRTIGKAKLYKLNEAEESVKELIKLHDISLIKDTKEHFAKKKVAIPA